MTLVRFAPSPTGKLHVGNIRAAVLNKLYAIKTGGKFLLRMDDTDSERSAQEFVDAINHDLAWLGIKHDLFARQSDRIALYDKATEQLKAKGYLYPCYETADELDRRRKRQQARGLPPVYDRAALKLTPEEKAKAETEGRRPHWRFKLSQQPVVWNDLIRGEVSINTASISDPVLIREDGRYLYTFASVVDDIDFKITHVIRGEDHVTNTAVQLELFKALGHTPTAFAHYAMIVGAGGEQLSKRLGSLSIESLREEEGIEPEAVLSLIAKIGTSDPIVARATIEELAAEFDFAKIGRAPAHFDPEELKTLNAKVLHLLPYDRIRPDLKRLGADLGPKFWAAIHDNLHTLKEARDWRDVVEGPIAPEIADPGFTEKAADLLPAGQFSEESWGAWTKAVSAATGRKGKDLFQPFRLALTGRPHGPEMKKLLPLIGRERAKLRLAGQRA
jgi:glutamyl-tRNA synthetase